MSRSKPSKTSLELNSSAWVLLELENWVFFIAYIYVSKNKSSW